MNPRTAFFIQGILEAVIPVYGYFQWNWDLSFILLFYFIDWILSLVLAGFKGRKRFIYSNDRSELSYFTKTLSLSILIAGISCALFALSTLNVKPEMSWGTRIIDFLLYKDMGVQQGFVLVPLIVLNGVLLFRQQFVAPRLFEKLSMKQIIQPLLSQNLLLLGLGGIYAGITSFTAIHEAIIVFATIAAITVYRMVFIREVLGDRSR